MPPVVPNPRDRLGRMLARPANGVRALSSQQDIAICDPSGLVVYRQGQLHQWPPAAWNPVQYTTGYGWEICDGLGQQVVERGGEITWSYSTTLAAAAAAGATSVTVGAFVNYSGAYLTIGGQTVESTDAVQSGSDWVVTISPALAQAQASGTAVQVVWTFVGSVRFV